MVMNYSDDYNVVIVLVALCCERMMKDDEKCIRGRRKRHIEK